MLQSSYRLFSTHRTGLMSWILFSFGLTSLNGLCFSFFSFQLLISVANIPGRPTLRASSCGTSTNWRESLFCCCTASMEQATDGAETAVIDGLVSSWSENIFVSFCLRAPGYGLTLWCALGLLVGAQYKCLSYSSYSQSYSLCWCVLD